jgi:transcriptional regulator with GAF, ATPase, and Fis domain
MTDPRADALVLLGQFQVTELTVGEALNRVADITLGALPSAAVAGMTMLDNDGQPTTAVYTDDDSPEIDAAQYREGKGPCLDAWLTRTVLRIDDIEGSADVYPGFVSACRDHGVRSTLSLPMVSADVALGALNLYARTTDAFGDEDEQLGLELAGVAGSVLSNVSAYWTAFDLGQHLNEAMTTRAVIEQAKGMLMASSPDLDADAAFDVLSKASQRENVKLNEIARRIVERRRPPGPDEGASP